MVDRPVVVGGTGPLSPRRPVWLLNTAGHVCQRHRPWG